MAKSLEQYAEERGWKFLEIDKPLPEPLDLSGINILLQGVAQHMRKTFENTRYGIGGVEDYSKSLRDKMIGMFGIYSAIHDKGALRLINSGSVRVFPSGYVLAQCHDPDDGELAGHCRYLTGFYDRKSGNFQRTDDNPKI